MIKKIILVGIITLMLVSTTPVYALGTQINNNITNLSTKTVISLVDEENKGSVNTNDADTSKLSNADVNWRTGWIKVNSTGKGLVLIVPLKLLRINVPIPTIQYAQFLPFRIENFVTLLVYNDTNANTTIQILKGKNKGENITLTGHHSILLGMFAMPPVNLLRNLLWDGVIDGIQPLGQLLGKIYGSSKGPVAWLISRIINKTIGGPIIKITKDQRDFLRDLKGIPPRYQINDPLFNITFINELREKLPDSLLWQIRIFGYMYPVQMFWNKMPIRTSLIKFEMPMQLKGYTPFVRWTEDPKLKPFVERVQDFLPDIFNQNITLK